MTSFNYILKACYAVMKLHDVRCRDMYSEERTREEVGCGGNEDVMMDEWSHQAGQYYE